MVAHLLQNKNLLCFDISSNHVMPYVPKWQSAGNLNPKWLILYFVFCELKCFSKLFLHFSFDLSNILMAICFDSGDFLQEKSDLLNTISRQADGMVGQ